MTKFFSRTVRRRREKGRVGLAIGPDGVAVAFVNAGQALEFWQFFDQLDDIERLLQELVAEHGWQGLPCSLVLHPIYYHLLLTETPAVETQELTSAVRWKIKELLDFPLEEAAIEYFSLPEDAYRGRQKMLYAAALRKSTLQGLVAPVEAAELNIDCIEISELALHKISARMPPGRGGSAIVQLYESEGFINLVEGGDIYLCRRLDIGLDQFNRQEDRQSFFDSLLLEIQRSLDFFESQLGKGVVTDLYYSPGLVAVEPIGEFLSAQLAVNVESLSLSNLGLDLEIVESTDEQLLRCTVAIGAALGPVKKPKRARKGAGG